MLPSPATYHVTSRGVARSDIFLDDEDRAAFVGLLRRIGRARGWTCHAYCLMNNHFHLLLATEIERLSSGMQLLKGRYARGFNDKYRRVGHLFQGRFDARVLRDDEHLGAACLYVWNNPVAVGLCDRVDEWPWSGRF